MEKITVNGTEFCRCELFIKKYLSELNTIHLKYLLNETLLIIIKDFDVIDICWLYCLPRKCYSKIIMNRFTILSKHMLSNMLQQITLLATFHATRAAVN